MAVLAMDLGGTKLAVALCHADGQMPAKQITQLDRRRGSEVGDLLRQEASRLLHQAVRDGAAVSGIGISVPGISRDKTGRVWAPKIQGWDNYPLLEEMSALSGGEIPVCIESDRACSILGEAWKGAARGCRNAIFVAVGTGIGAGIMADGRILRGAHGIAGAVGWMALDRSFDPKHSACGCLEYHASGEGIARAATLLLESAPEYRGVLSGRDVTAPDVFSAFEAGDPIASRVIEQCFEFWGMATANLVSAFDPEKIIFGGGVFGPAVRLLDAIRAEAHKWAPPVTFAQVKLEASQLGADAGLCGAGYLALESTEQGF